MLEVAGFWVRNERPRTYALFPKTRSLVETRGDFPISRKICGEDIGEIRYGGLQARNYPDGA